MSKSYNPNEKIRIECIFAEYEKKDVHEEYILELLHDLPDDQINYKYGDRKESILHIASNKSHYKVVKYLLNHPRIDINVCGKADLTPFMIAIFNGDKQLFELFCDHPQLDVNKAFNVDGYTPLMNAVMFGSSTSIELITNHPDVDINRGNKNGMTALMLVFNAVGEENQLEYIKILLKHPDIDINKKDGNGTTALGWYQHFFAPDMIEKIKILFDNK